MHLVFRVQREIKTHLGEHGSSSASCGQNRERQKQILQPDKEKQKKMSFPHFTCLIKYLNMFFCLLVKVFFCLHIKQMPDV